MNCRYFRGQHTRIKQTLFCLSSLAGVCAHCTLYTHSDIQSILHKNAKCCARVCAPTHLAHFESAPRALRHTAIWVNGAEANDDDENRAACECGKRTHATQDTCDSDPHRERANDERDTHHTRFTIFSTRGNSLMDQYWCGLVYGVCMCVNTHVGGRRIDAFRTMPPLHAAVSGPFTLHIHRRRPHTHAQYTRIFIYTRPNKTPWCS